MALSVSPFKPFNLIHFITDKSRGSIMGSAGAQVMQGYNSMSSPNQKVNFTGFIEELEHDIAETRKELNFCKKEV